MDSILPFLPTVSGKVSARDDGRGGHDPAVVPEAEGNVLRYDTCDREVPARLEGRYSTALLINDSFEPAPTSSE